MMGTLMTMMREKMIDVGCGLNLTTRWKLLEDDVCADKKRDNQHHIGVEADLQTSDAWCDEDTEGSLVHDLAECNLQMLDDN